MTRPGSALDALGANGADRVTAARATEHLDLRQLAGLVREDGAHLHLETVTTSGPWSHSDDAPDADEVPTGSIFSELHTVSLMQRLATPGGETRGGRRSLSLSDPSPLDPPRSRARAAWSTSALGGQAGVPEAAVLLGEGHKPAVGVDSVTRCRQLRRLSG
jgi:hypothetical protein